MIVDLLLDRTASEAVVVEDGNRTQYTPQVRILKRKSDAHSTAARGTRQVALYYCNYFT